MSRTRNPPEDFSESKFEKATIGIGLYQEPLIVLYWNPRPDEKRWAATTQKAYDEAEAAAGKAYDDAATAAGKAHGETMTAADKAYGEAMTAADKAYYEAKTAADKAYGKAAIAARKAYDEATTPAWKAHGEAMTAAQFSIAANHVFEPSSIHYVLYRGDEDLWVDVDDAEEALNLTRSALADMQELMKSIHQKIERTKEWAKKGVKVGRFDPSKVFVRRHGRRMPLR